MSAVDASRGGALCSTPFGITEFRIWHLMEGVRCRDVCSTPFGITEFRMPIPENAAIPIPCAQRLSASLNSALSARRRECCETQECSTPFGITEFRIHPGRGHGLGDDPCSTPFGITEFRIKPATPERGQREVLNAFRHH